MAASSAASRIARRPSASAGSLHDDGGRRADGPEGAGRQHRLEHVGALRHDEVPPDVTVGDEELVVGAEDDDEVADVARGSRGARRRRRRAGARRVDDDAAVARVARTAALVRRRAGARVVVGHHDPMAAVAPVAATTAPRVRARSRDFGSVPLCGRARLGWS